MSTRLFFIGDSFVNGTGDPEVLGWVGRVCATAIAQGQDWTVYNLGIRGDTTELILQRWRQEVDCRLARGCLAQFVFSFGANDVDLENGLPRVAMPESLNNARQLLTEARQLGPVLMVGSPPIADDSEANKRLVKLSKGIEEICQDLSIPFLPTLEPLLHSSTWIGEALTNDGAHPRSAGYQELSKLVSQWSDWQQWMAQKD